MVKLIVLIVRATILVQVNHQGQLITTIHFILSNARLFDNKKLLRLLRKLSYSFHLITKSNFDTIFLFSKRISVELGDIVSTNKYIKIILTYRMQKYYTLLIRLFLRQY